MNRLFAENALETMRREIAACGGNEVFFVGHTNGAGMVIDVEPLARGNRDAVAAIVIASRCGDVIVHNHPDGLLTPPPLAIAHHLIRAFVEGEAPAY